MHLPSLIAELQAIARSQPELALVALLAADWRTIAGPGTAGAPVHPRREAAAAAILAVHAEAIRSLPWHLPDAVLWELPRVAGTWNWRQACQAFLRGGAGLSAASTAPGGGCWLPAWLLQEAARRTPQQLPPLAQRWALPARYPIPTLQWLVGPLDQEPPLADLVLGGVALLPGLELPDAGLPQGYLVPRRALPGRDQRLRLAACAPQAGLRAVLGSGPTPLHGLWLELVLPGLGPATADAGVSGSGWDGRLSGTCLRRRPGGVAAAPGWLAAAAAALGWRCAGAPAQATRPAEEALLIACGGRVQGLHEGGGQLLPPALGGWLLGLLPGIPVGSLPQPVGQPIGYTYHQGG